MTAAVPNLRHTIDTAAEARRRVRPAGGLLLGRPGKARNRGYGAATARE